MRKLRFLDVVYPKLPNTIVLYKQEFMFWISGITFREFILGVEDPLSDEVTSCATPAGIIG